MGIEPIRKTRLVRNLLSQVMTSMRGKAVIVYRPPVRRKMAAARVQRALV
jgi:hypothetical protein